MANERLVRVKLWVSPQGVWHMNIVSRGKWLPSVEEVWMRVRSRSDVTAYPFTPGGPELELDIDFDNQDLESQAPRRMRWQ